MAETVIVAIRASAGGVQALKILASGLASDFAGAVLITLDVSPASPRLLPEIMRAAGPLTVRYAQHGDEIEPAHIYIAPPDRHMLLEASGRLMLSRGPKENHARPRNYHSNCHTRHVGRSEQTRPARPRWESFASL